jgi:hypothetical protein
MEDDASTQAKYQWPSLKKFGEKEEDGEETRR